MSVNKQTSKQKTPKDVVIGDRTLDAGSGDEKLLPGAAITRAPFSLAQVEGSFQNKGTLMKGKGSQKPSSSYLSMGKPRNHPGRKSTAESVLRSQSKNTQVLLGSCDSYVGSQLLIQSVSQC